MKPNSSLAKVQTFLHIQNLPNKKLVRQVHSYIQLLALFKQVEAAYAVVASWKNNSLHKKQHQSYH